MMIKNITMIVGTAVLVVSLVMPGSGQEKPSTGPDFVREILPILRQRCFECHNEKKHKAGLRLDAKAAAASLPAV